MDEDKDVPSADHDSPWKEALEVYFEPFMALLFPSVHAQVDWAQPVEFLDKELQALDGDAEQGRQYVDKYHGADPGENRKDSRAAKAMEISATETAL
ncbi:hypothetical protein SAMN05216526_1543 [Ectothiorhodosinus mongolicus]|uniref:Uncharacterized protein n=1 Tax=Ectothiorhodosinus mongolicus TaxID=233100 RepID=A0A1R3W171_9GAMM|nr:hypothetical protein [Ectothiorhodosinus mongolicus]SIT71378.1 hypothetical protein SAMN05216526_1543 [Ectothiorhodosinus mongolicus]